MSASIRFSPLRRAASLLVLAALAGLGGFALMIALLLSTPIRTTVGLPPADLAGAETVQIPSPSGSVLHGWWLAGGPQPGGGAVVLLHGRGASRLTMVERARVLAEHQFAVLLFDFQAEGESPGDRVTFGHLEALDAVAAVAFVRERLPGERVGAVAVSLGGAAALLGLRPLKVDALVLESVYLDAETALSNGITASLGAVAGPVFTSLIATASKVLLPLIIGVAPNELRPIDHIHAATTPLLIAAGTEDDIVPIGEARTLFDRAPQPKLFWEVQGATHSDLEQFDPAAYWRVVLPFLRQHLQSDCERWQLCPAPGGLSNPASDQAVRFGRIVP